MNGAEKLRKIMDTVLGTLCVLLFSLMILVGTYQIAARYFFNRPSTVSEELLTYSFTWLALLAAAYVFGKREHMRMGFIVDRLGAKKRFFFDLLREVLVFLFSLVVMIVGGIAIIRLTMTQVTASLGIPMGVVYAAVPLSGVLSLIYSILNIIRCTGDKHNMV